MAFGVLTKGLIALGVSRGRGFLVSGSPGNGVDGESFVWLRGWHCFSVIAAPWHILAGLRNTGGQGGHGFFWFYFVNEHFLRFLGKRYPRDYNKLPWALYWSLHLVWLFPWSLYLPAAIRTVIDARKGRSAKLTSAAALGCSAGSWRVCARFLCHLDQPGVLHASLHTCRC